MPERLLPTKSKLKGMTSPAQPENSQSSIRLGSKAFASSSAIYLLSNVLNAIVPFALLPILTRYLDPAQYGQVAMFQTLVAALGAFIGLNVVGAANRKFYDHGLAHDDLAHFLLACLQITVVTTLVALAFTLHFNQQLASWFGIEPNWVVWAPIVTATGFVSVLRLGQWQIRDQAVKYGVFQVSQGLAGMLLSVVLVVGMAQGAAGRVYAQIWIMPIFSVVAFLLMFKDGLLPSRYSWKPDCWREALNYGLPLVPHVAGMFLLSLADRLVVNDQLGLGQAGIYMVAVQLSLVVPVIIDAVNKAYVPWLYGRLQRKKVNELKEVVRLTYWLLGVLLVGAVLAFLVGDVVVRIVAGEQYESAGKALGWLVLGHVLGGMSTVLSHYILFVRRTGILSVATIAAGLLNVTLLLALVHPFGITGAAFAFAISMGFRLLFTWVAAQKCHPMPWLS